MGPEPHTSVSIDSHLQHWDAENLFVVGASVYPHNSGYNPTGPLAALALRLGNDVPSPRSCPKSARRCRPATDALRTTARMPVGEVTLISVR